MHAMQLQVAIVIITIPAIARTHRLILQLPACTHRLTTKETFLTLLNKFKLVHKAFTRLLKSVVPHRDSRGIQ